MLQKILKVFLYLLVIALISAAVIAGFYFTGQPLEGAYITLGVIFTIWFLYVVIRKLIIRARAKAQVERVLQEEEPSESDLGMSEKELIKELRSNWRSSVKALRNSQLKLRGDPLYVLPWYMVFGKPSSGKSTSLRSAKLLSPKIDFPEHADGSTLNLEWWLYEEAIVIDTAGRYAVPDEENRDRKEWRTFLRMLASHKQKEPLSGVVVVVAADRLLNDSEDMLLEEGRQLRASISDLMGNLEAKPPVYLMITKSDLIPGFTEWCEYLPDDALRQAMGYLNEQEGGTLDEIIDTALDVVLARMKELRLLMLERSDNPGDALLTLPVEIEKLRKGLHLFANTALKENVYQETPRFRGLYLTSSKLRGEAADESERGAMGAFLQQFYTRILPSDRGLTDNLTAAVRLRNAVRKYLISGAGALTVIALFALSSLYAGDSGELELIRDSFDEIQLGNHDINEELETLNRLRDLIISLDTAQNEWLIPWTGTFSRPVHVRELIDTYNSNFRALLEKRIDARLAKIIATADSRETSLVAGGVVRRINKLKVRMTQAEGDEPVSLGELPQISPEYIRLMEMAVNGESAVLFDQLYVSYIEWNNSTEELAGERAKLQTALVDLLERNQGDYSWIIDWAESLGGEPVRLSDFWSGTYPRNADLPRVSSAFTLEGRDAINGFMAELMQANNGDGTLARIKEEFDEFYERKYVRAWMDFARRFDEGQNGLTGKKAWLTSVERMATEGNPYFALIERLHTELKPITHDDDYTARTLVDYFVDMRNFVGDGGKGGGNGKAAKMALKLVKKAGKAGKLVAKAGKTALKAKKKMGGKSAAQLEGMLEPASKTYSAYKQALTEVAFSADSSERSMTSVASLFMAPNSPGSREGAVAQAETAVLNLQMLAGKPNPDSRLFWNLYSGPIRVAYEYMREEAACHLQKQWERSVLAELQGLPKTKMGSALIGDGGLVWKFIDTNATAFLSKRHFGGFSPIRVDGRAIPWTGPFMQFINDGSKGRHIVNGEYVVRLLALPTGVNQSAKLSPYSSILELRCADGVQKLANYNYNSSKDFKWSLEKCGDVTLTVSIGQVTLHKEYKGQKAFPEFLADFRDGHRVFVAGEFPEVESQLRNLDVEAIDVNYEINGQKPVIEMLKSVPLGAPQKIAECWE